MRVLPSPKKSLLVEKKFIYWCESGYKLIVKFSVSPLWLNHGRQLSGTRFLELFEVFWGDGPPHHSRHFLDSFLSLRLDLKLWRDSSNHRKIGDINEAPLICKHSTQTVSVYLNAFGSNLMNSKMISFEDCVQMAKAKLNYFIQGWITFERIALGRCGLRRLLANLKGFNLNRPV